MTIYIFHFYCCKSNQSYIENNVVFSSGADRNLEQSIVVLSASVDIIIVLGKSELKMENHQEQMLSLIKLVASPSSWDVSDSEFP